MGDLSTAILVVEDDEDVRDTIRNMLIRAGFAATRPQAIRWALDRIRERPAYQRLRELRSDADKLKNEF